ncbi:MAG: UDP binding domain-containing protein, partial [Burkholderiaceae bacterium]
SFKTGTDDLRESPLVALAEQLIGKGMNLAIYDPEVQLSQLLGANRRFIETRLPHIGKLLRPDMAAVIEESEVLVVGLTGADVKRGLEQFCQPGQVVLDLVRIGDCRAIQADVQGLCW